MIICESCTSKNREGSLFCSNCGIPLLDTIKERHLTRKLGKTDGLGMAQQSPIRGTWGTTRLTEDSEILLRVDGTSEAIPVQIEKRGIVGREDQSSGNYPDINLVPFGGLEKGVSRVHAVIEREEDTLTIMDMGSSNGTYLNGQRLAQNQPRVIRDGDEIRFGKLTTRIYFG